MYKIFLFSLSLSLSLSLCLSLFFGYPTLSDHSITIYITWYSFLFNIKLCKYFRCLHLSSDFLKHFLKANIEILLNEGIDRSVLTNEPVIESFDICGVT